MEPVILHNRRFELMLTAEEISGRIRQMGAEISASYASKNPVLLCVLKGAFVFTADLIRQFHFPCEVMFVQLQSYSGSRSGGKVHMHLPLSGQISGRHIIILEDIAETGLSLIHLIAELEKLNPLSIQIASLLVKPSMMQQPVDIRFRGFEIGEAFVVGYGLDYDGLGRNLPDLYAEIT